MPDTPDFEQIALMLISDLLERTGQDLVRPVAQSKGQAQSAVAEQLRLLWNARGAADIATIEAALASQMGGTASGPYVKNLDRELRKLDR